jgi:hypothetical protein
VLAIGHRRVPRLDERNQISQRLALERRVRLELDRHRSAAAATRNPAASVAGRGRHSCAGLSGCGRLGSGTARASSTASTKE